MANQPEDFRFNLQLFAESADEGEPAFEEMGDPFDNLSFDSDEDPAEGDELDTENPEEIPNHEAEEYDEITYNQETVKIPVSERTTYLQKGYNYDKIHGRLTETEAALRARDEEVSRRFGNNGIHTWDDLVKGWDNAQQAQAQQQIQAYDQQTNATIRQMQEEGYDSYQIQMFADQRALVKENYELSQRLTGIETNREQGRIEAENARNAEEGTKLILSEYDDLKKEFGDLLPEIAGQNPVDKLRNLIDGLDEATRQDMFNGIPLKKAFIANNHAAILKHQQEIAEKRTVANISDRAKRGAETNNNAPAEGPKISKRQAELAKQFGVPASEVAKRTKQR